MKYIEIDTFGGVVSNADSEDIRPDLGQSLINFSLNKAGVLKYNDNYVVGADFTDELFAGVFYWTDFSFNNQRYIIAINKDTNALQLLSSSYAKIVSITESAHAGTSTDNSFYTVNPSTFTYRSAIDFLSSGNYVRMTSSKSHEPVILQFINKRKFWGYYQSDWDWFSKRVVAANNAVTYTNSEDGFFADIAYPRMDYARGKKMWAGGDLSLSFQPQITVKNHKRSTNYLNIGSIDVADSTLVGNHVYDSATVNTSYYVHEYAIALIYDGNQIGPLSNSSYTRIKTVKPSTRYRPRGMGARVAFNMHLATMSGSTATVRDVMQNPRVTGVALYRSIAGANYTKIKSKSNLRRVGTYRFDRSEDDMNRVSIAEADIQILDHKKLLPIDMARHSSNITDVTSVYLKTYWDNDGNGEPEEFSQQIASIDDTYGVITVNTVTATNFIPDTVTEYAITENSNAIGNGAGTIYNSGIKGVGGEMWIIVPGNLEDGDGYYKNCIITDQTVSSSTDFDCIVESYLGMHKTSGGAEVYYHACRLAGESLWDDFKDSGAEAIYIYRTNEPIYWYLHHISHSSNNEIKKANIFIYDTDPISLEGHPYPEDKINHGYEVQYSFMGRRFVGNVKINLGDTDEEIHQNMVLYSEVGMPDVIPSANFIQIQDVDGGEITGFSSSGGDLIIFTTTGIYSLNMRSPDPQSWVLSTISNQIGCIASDSITNIKDQIFFASDHSCYYLAHTHQLVPVSEPINDFYRSLPDGSKNKTKTIYEADKNILHWLFGSTDIIDGSSYVYELHLEKGDVTWAKRSYGRPLSLIAKDFDNNPVYVSNSERISNPLAR